LVTSRSCVLRRGTPSRGVLDFVRLRRGRRAGAGADAHSLLRSRPQAADVAVPDVAGWAQLSVGPGLVRW